MKLFAQPGLVSRPLSPASSAIGLSAAGLIVVMVVAQLFSFEDFVDSIVSYGVEQSSAQLVVAAFASLGVFALPFLLHMYISPLLRIMSMICGWLVVLILLTSQLLLNVYADGADSTGLLGAVVQLPVGWWSVVLSVGFGVLVGWMSWRMWPLRSNSQKSQEITWN